MGNNKGKEETRNTSPACVVKVVSETRVAINRGARDDIREGMRFVVYKLSTGEIEDPFTRESLGQLEIVKGTGKVISVQETMSILESDQKERTERTMGHQAFGAVIYPAWGGVEVTFERKPFESPNVGDLVKRV